MDPLQMKALNALEPFILLSQSANSPRAAGDLITQATSVPNTYVFAELLATPNIQALRTAAPEHSCYLTLLEIFAWGTFTDYQVTPNLPPLTPAQATKLRQLSLISICKTPQHLTYPRLLTLLALPSARDLEELVISAIYAQLLRASLSPATEQLLVSSVAPLRDLPPGSVPALLVTLREWSARTEQVLAGIDAEEAAIQVRARERRVRRTEAAAAQERMSAAVALAAAQAAKEKGAGGKRGLGNEVHDDSSAMDVDENGGVGQRKSVRSGRFGGLGRR
ncbi:MAG: hypothetical protein M1829_005134 [Trizodia sp. TS-e1964]|nr:MAG: hypothetical protein M1829_005134 [Trizodia sp. TS-e1964]